MKTAVDLCRHYGLGKTTLHRFQTALSREHPGFEDKNKAYQRTTIASIPLPRGGRQPYFSAEEMKVIFTTAAAFQTVGEGWSANVLRGKCREMIKSSAVQLANGDPDRLELLSNAVCSRTWLNKQLALYGPDASNYGALGVNLSSAFTGQLTAACVSDPRDKEGIAALTNAAPLDVSTGPLAVMLKRRNNAGDPDGQGANVVIRQFVYDNIIKPYAINASQVNKVLENFKRAKGNTLTASTLPTKTGLVMNYELCQVLKDNKARKDALIAEKVAHAKARSDARQQQFAASFQAAQALLASISGKDAQGVTEVIKTDRVKVGTMKDLLSHLAATTEEKSNVPKMKKPELIEKLCSVAARGGQILQEAFVQQTRMDDCDEEGEDEVEARAGGAYMASNPAMHLDQNDQEFDYASDASDAENEAGEA